MKSGLARMAAGPKEAPPAKKPAASPQDTALGEAFDAYKDGDRDGFIAAMRLAISAPADEPEEDETTDDQE